MAEENFSPEQSLQVIRSMLERVKQDFSENSFFLLLWGWLVLSAALIQYILMVYVKYPNHWLSWNLMWVGAIVSIIHGIRRDRRQKAKTYIEETMKYFGMGTGITFTVLTFILGYYELWLYAFPFYLVIYGYMSWVCGSIIHFVPLRWAGGACWIIAAVSVFTTYDVHLLLMALAVLIAYIIPGYMLRNRKKLSTI